MLKNIDISGNRIYTEMRKAIVGNLILTLPEPGVVILFHAETRSYYIKHVTNVQNYTVDLFKILRTLGGDTTKVIEGVPVCVMMANAKSNVWQVWVYYTAAASFVNTFHTLLSPHYGHLMTQRGGLDDAPRCLCVVKYPHDIYRYVSVHANATAEEIEKLSNESLLRGLKQEERNTTPAWQRMRWLFLNKSAEGVMKLLKPLEIGRYDAAVVNHKTLPAEIREYNKEAFHKFATNGSGLKQTNHIF